MDFTQIFLEGVKGISWYNEGLDIVKRNSSARLWLIGGAVYRSIISQLYGTPIPEKTDLDFIVEKAAERMALPEGWEEKRTRFGSPRFVNGKKQIDFVPLAGISLIHNRSIEYTIETYLTATSLTIHSIAYEINEGRVIGEKGIDAIRRRVVEANDLEVADYTAGMVGRTAEEMIKKKAASLGFTPVLPARQKSI